MPREVRASACAEPDGLPWTALLGVRTYRLFYFEKHEPDRSSATSRKVAKALWGSSGKDARVLNQFRRLLSLMTEDDRQTLLGTARRMARK
jgi:hypothetical protein